jgi:S-formylglutathione hydrolase FrmB
MAVTEVHFNAGNAIGKMTAATVILPEGFPGPFPVLYLLHGLSDDHTAWVRRTRLERLVANLPLIVVMPDAGRSYYTDAVALEHHAYETLIVRDLIGWVDATFRTISRREGRAISGLSMGGYGAMKIALKHPEMFCAVNSHSGSVARATKPGMRNRAWREQWGPVWGTKSRGGPDDIFALARRCDQARLPAIRMDCGKQDYLLADNRRLHRLFRRLGIPHDYAEPPGWHGWKYWDRQLKPALDFLCRALRIARG